MQQLARNEHASEGDHGESEQHRSEHRPGRERIGETVVGVRPEVFLEHHLESIGEAVEQTPPHELDLREGNAHVGAIGADAVGHDGGLLALDPGKHGSEQQQHRHRIGDENETDYEILHHAGMLSDAISAANSVSASATDAFFGKHGSNALTTPSKLV